jgi:thiol:disulfide interchange protein DsbD
LGLLMSLTPCIYPMIPITMGILQAQGDKKSLGKNALIAFVYSCGIAFTFALLGLTAAFTGQLFGKIMQNPLVKVLLIAWLIYMAFGMLGLYELYMPKKLGQDNQIKKGNPFLRAFLFGAISGTIASPCLSPGLALLLTIVAALADITKGFILLFAFGIGLGIPLTIIGTFSGSVSLLPRAGLWMIEVKRIFGILLLLLAFSFAGKILTPTMLIIFTTSCSWAAGYYYYTQITKRDSQLMRFYKIVMISLLAITPLIYYKVEQKKIVKKISWLFNIEESQKSALKENKNIIIDFSTDYCSLCKHLEAKLLETDLVAKYLDTKFVNLYLNLSKAENQKWQNEFKIKGVPTVMIVDHSLKEIRRFGSELIDYSPIQFIALLKNYENKK